jgi:hypothetical protein
VLVVDIARQCDGVAHGFEKQRLPCASVNIVAGKDGMVAIFAEERDEPAEHCQPVPAVFNDKRIEDQRHFLPLAVGYKRTFQVVILYALERKRLFNGVSKRLYFAEHPFWRHFEVVTHDFQHDIAARVECMKRFSSGHGSFLPQVFCLAH